MKNPVKLSQEEIDTLMGGIADGSVDTDGVLGVDGDVRKFQFGIDDLTMSGDFYALHLINERFSRSVRQQFLPLLRFQPRISASEPVLMPFDNYTASLSTFSSLNSASMDPLRGNALFVVEPELISTFVNAFFGGTRSPAQARTPEFTPTEERTLQIVLDGIFKELSKAWHDVYPLRFTHVSSETNPQFTSFVEASDIVVLNSFEVQIPDARSFKLDILYPHQSLKPISAILRSRIQSETTSSDGWKERMAEAVSNVPMPLRSVLSEPSISINDVIALTPGDILPISFADEVTTLVSRKPYFKGQLGKTDETIAVRISEMLLQDY